MKILFSFLATVMLFVTAAAQPAEFSTTDITKLADFSGNTTTFFGIKKGMTKAAVVKALNALPQFTWKYDSWNTVSENVNSTTETRIYVTLADKTGYEDDATVLYLLWDDKATQLTSIVIYEAAAKYAVGNTKKLFTTAAISGTADFLFFLKGKAVVENETYTTKYKYAGQHFSFTSYKDLDGKLKVWINFSDK